MSLTGVTRIKIMVLAFGLWAPSAVMAENTPYDNSIDKHQAQFEKSGPGPLGFC